MTSIQRQAKSEHRANVSQELYKKARDWMDCSGSRGGGGRTHAGAVGRVAQRSAAANHQKTRPEGGEERRRTRRQDEVKRN